MHALILTERFSWKKTSGWALRKHSLLDVLGKMGTIDLLITNPIAAQDRVPLLDFLSKRCRKVYLQPNSQNAACRFRQIFRRWGRASSYRMSVLQVDDAIIEFIHDAICSKTPDIIFFETTFVAQYIEHIPATLRSRCVISPHNVESEIEWGLFAATRGMAKLQSWVRYIDIRRLESTEVPRFRWIAPVSDRDAFYYRFICPQADIVALPNVVDVQSYSFNAVRTGESLIFIGSLNWKYNTEGLYWFIEKVLPLITDRFPNATLAVIGRAEPEHLQRLERYGSNVRVVGPVADVTSYFGAGKVFVCPLFDGSGTRLKLIEAFATGIPVVSTSKGCEGLGVTDGDHLFIADSENAFASAIMRMLDGSQNEIEAMVRAARRHAEHHLSYETLQSRLAVLQNAIAGPENTAKNSSL